MGIWGQKRQTVLGLSLHFLILHTTYSITCFEWPDCALRTIIANKEHWLLVHLGFRELIKVYKASARMSCLNSALISWTPAAQKSCFIIASPLSDFVPVKYLNTMYSSSLCPSHILLLYLCTVCHFVYMAWETMKDPWEKHAFCWWHHFQQKRSH